MLKHIFFRSRRLSCLFVRGAETDHLWNQSTPVRRSDGKTGSVERFLSLSWQPHYQGDRLRLLKTGMAVYQPSGFVHSVLTLSDTRSVIAGWDCCLESDVRTVKILLRNYPTPVAARTIDRIQRAAADDDSCLELLLLLVQKSHTASSNIS